jgi:hypothetical protein
MASYLLTVSSSGSLDGVRDVAAPAGAVVEWKEAPETTDGLERWSLELAVAGSIAAWIKSDAYGAFWDFLEKALQRLEVRPQGRLTLTSRADPHRIAVTFAYMGAHELKRAREDVSKRLPSLTDPASRHIAKDLELTVHG